MGLKMTWYTCIFLCNFRAVNTLDEFVIQQSKENAGLKDKQDQANTGVRLMHACTCMNDTHIKALNICSFGHLLKPLMLFFLAAKENQNLKKKKI